MEVYDEIVCLTGPKQLHPKNHGPRPVDTKHGASRLRDRQNSTSDTAWSPWPEQNPLDKKNNIPKYNKFYSFEISLMRAI